MARPSQSSLTRLLTVPQPKNNKSDLGRQIRIERPPEPEIASEDSGTWAISYSDMLMVLMSFFVIFFSFSPKKTESMISSIVLTMDKGGVGEKTGSGEKSGIGEGTSAEDKSAAGLGTGSEAAKLAEEFHRAMLEKLKATKLDAELSSSVDSVVVDLPDSIYKPRGFVATPVVTQTLDKVFSMIQPYAGQVDIYFVGHTDADPISHSNEYLSDNFVLSTLRATHALQYALKKGLPQNHLFAQGGAENVRNSRTLSIIVKIRPVQPAH